MVKRIISKFYILLVIFCSLGMVQQAWATQVHTEPEGLYGHQIAHLFFLFSMGILIYWLREHRLVLETGWRYVQYAAFFFILWNLDAMTVHYLDNQEGIFRIINAGTWGAHIQLNTGGGLMAAIYYLVKLDHLLCVPAIIFLYGGLRQLLKQAQKPDLKEHQT